MIRLATISDYKRLLQIFEAAKQFMKNTGNPNQWSEDYPGVKFIDEIKSGEVYVFDEDNHIYGAFLLHIGIDKTYNYIEGKWLNDNLYGTIHRVASDGSHKGLFVEMLDFCKTKVDDLRIDTHEDNKVMQKLILDNGFEYCGIIYIENGEPRRAYQLTRDKKFLINIK